MRDLDVSELLVDDSASDLLMRNYGFIVRLNRMHKDHCYQHGFSSLR